MMKMVAVKRVLQWQGFNAQEVRRVTKILAEQYVEMV